MKLITRIADEIKKNKPVGNPEQLKGDRKEMEEKKVTLEDYIIELKKELSYKVSSLSNLSDDNPYAKIYLFKNNIDFVFKDIMGKKRSDELDKEQYVKSIEIGKELILENIINIHKAYEEVIEINLNLGYLKGQLDIMSKLLNIKDEPVGNDKMEEKKSDK